MVGMGFAYSEDIDGSYEIEISGNNVAAKASLKAPWPAGA